MQSAAITKPDVLDDLPSIKASVGYRLDGQVIDYLTASLSTYAL